MFVLARAWCDLQSWMYLQASGSDRPQATYWMRRLPINKKMVVEGAGRGTSIPGQWQSRDIEVYLKCRV